MKLGSTLFLATAFVVCGSESLRMPSRTLTSLQVVRRIPASSKNHRTKLDTVAGGVIDTKQDFGGKTEKYGFLSAWGVLGVIYILFNGVKRLVPIALEPFTKGDFTTTNWVAYGTFVAFMAYAEVRICSFKFNNRTCFD